MAGEVEIYNETYGSMKGLLSIVRIRMLIIVRAVTQLIQANHPCVCIIADDRLILAERTFEFALLDDLDP